MRVVVDAMGGDYAPTQVIKGAIKALDLIEHEIILVGDKDIVESELKALGVYGNPRIVVKHASQTIGMDEQPVIALKQKRNSSISVGLSLLRDGKAEVFVSAGNTGAVMVAAKLILGTLPFVRRPAIAVVLPCKSGKFVLIDAGANVDSKPENLVEFAVMGSVFASIVLGKDNPRVGLLNIGEEDIKGNSVVREAHSLLRGISFINFLGNVEAKELYSGKFDVVVCDGYVGNLVLKVSESAESYMTYLLRELFSSGFLAKIAFLLIRNRLKALKKKTDYKEYGGAPLIGVKGVCVISHGSSNDTAIANAIVKGVDLYEARINERIEDRLNAIFGSREGEKSLVEYIKEELKRRMREIGIWREK